MSSLKSKVAVAIIAATVSYASSVSAERLPKVLTPISADELTAVLRQAHIEQFGRQPNNQRLAMGWAQVALENGRGRAVWNHNLGNIGPGRQDTSDWYFHTPFVKYRSFKTFDDSARAYWRTVGRCTSATNAFDAGMPVVAAAALKRCGYYGAPEGPYAAALAGLYYNGLTYVISHRKKLQNEDSENREKIELELRQSYSPECACCVWR